MAAQLHSARSLLSSLVSNFTLPSPPSIRTLAKTLGGLQLALGPFSPASSPDVQPLEKTAGGGTPALCENPQLSCVVDAVASCCFEAPGGQLLLTQFWDTQPATGPDESWTIHGLWPDHCDGSFDSRCDSSREYTGIGSIVKKAGLDDLYEYMSTYWKDINGDDENFWEHEWSKHGTCIHTLRPSCYTDYQTHEELLDFLDILVKLFKQTPTYDTLAAAGIKPSTSTRYSVDAIQSALKEAHGAEVTLGCRNGKLNQVFYHYNINGSVPRGTFVPAAPDGSKSSCHGNVKYEPKA